jgi:hypothetical protein
MKRHLTIWTIVACGCVLVARSAGGQEPAPSSSDGGVAPSSGDGGTTSSAPLPPEADAAAAPAPATATADAGAPAPSPGLGEGATELARFRYANTWDLNLEGGGGYVFGSTDKGTGLVRARPGVLLVRNDSFYQLGATAEYLWMLKRPAFGLQAEYLHLQLGTWIQIGGSIDTKGRPGGMAAVGLSIFGIEAQVREFDASPDPAFVLLGKIRLPLGILVYGLQTKK